MARTIDNLGLDTSTQYAENKEAYEESYIRDALGIQGQTKIDVTLPFYPSEFDLLFGLGERRAIWPSVAPPPRYHSSRRAVFTDQILPRFGTPEGQEAQLERLESFGEEEIARHPVPKEAEEVSREHKALLKCLQTLHTLNEESLAIYPKRVQYQKG